MKTSLGLVALVAGLYLAGMGFANSADWQKVAATDVAQAPHFWTKDPVAHSQKRLDSLSKKLNLTRAQQPAWTTFSSAMLKLAQERAQERAGWKSADHAKLKDMSTPDRIEYMAARMRTGAEKLSKLASDTKIFYDQLSPEQKTIFNLSAEREMHRGMRMPHHMHR